jgi:predicted N-acyltransferase
MRSPQGISIELLTGAAITEAHWDAFFRLLHGYRVAQMGPPYLNRRFFLAAWRAMADRVLLVMANGAAAISPGALNLIGSDTLYGPLLGSVEDHPFLHFEVCYYQAIDFALAHGLAGVEAGAQGSHKLASGLPAADHLFGPFTSPIWGSGGGGSLLAQERREVEFKAKCSRARAVPAEADDGGRKCAARKRTDE